MEKLGVGEVRAAARYRAALLARDGGGLAGLWLGYNFGTAEMG
jgi:hypothetical protein